MTYFSGTIERVIFENPSTFFKIILLEIEDTDSGFDDFEIIVTGTIADVIEGEDYTFWGQMTQHPKYGDQLKVERYERAKPSAAGLVKYFSSQQFKGIGQKIAQKIVDLYGQDPIDKILEDASQLDQISGLSKATKEAFLARLRLNYGSEQILAKLAQYGLSGRLALAILEQYKEESLAVIEENPYQLVEDISGFGFKLADQLAEQVGIDSQSPQRFRAALLHALLENSLNQGDTYMEAKDLLDKSLFLLEEARQVELAPEQVAQELSNLISDGKVQNSGTKIFDNSLFHAEAGIKKHLTRILERDLDQLPPRQTILEVIEAVEEDFAITYDQTQKEAILQAIQSKVFILTGGPGTGKTTVINGLIESYARLHDIDLHKNAIPILLAAPTGRAARRMTDLTGLPSATIHRHLGLTGDNDYQTISDYLDCQLIIIDEFSMVDTWLSNQLFSALASDTQVIIVGDSDQLPSVGPGQVLADLLKIKELPQTALTKIFRQSDDSTIVTLASQIRQGSLPADFSQKKADRSYFEAQSNHIPQMIVKIVSSALKSGISPQDVQVLAPMYRGQAGIDNLNLIMQELINPLEDRLDFKYNDSSFRVGDKILHLVNDTEANVFNGDIGYITELMPAKYSESKQDELTINFDGMELTYPRTEWAKIRLAYAMSIHKSQGSEFQVVILPLTRQGGRLLQRNLIYTAITRSKSKLIMLGEMAAFDYAIHNQGASRKTYLLERFDQGSQNETSDNHIASSKTLPDSSPIKKENQEPAARDGDLLQDPMQEKTEKNFRLSLDNLLTIDPLIGLTEADFDQFFKKES